MKKNKKVIKDLQQTVDIKPIRESKNRDSHLESNLPKNSSSPNKMSLNSEVSQNRQSTKATIL